MSLVTLPSELLFIILTHLDSHILIPICSCINQQFYQFIKHEDILWYELAKRQWGNKKNNNNSSNESLSASSLSSPSSSHISMNSTPSLHDLPPSFSSWRCYYIHAYHLAHLHPTYSHTIHDDEILHSTWNHHGTHFATASRDSTAKYWKFIPSSPPFSFPSLSLLWTLRFIQPYVFVQATFTYDDSLLILQSHSDAENRGLIVVVRCDIGEILHMIETDPGDCMNTVYPSSLHFTTITLNERLLCIHVWELCSIDAILVDRHDIDLGEHHTWPNFVKIIELPVQYKYKHKHKETINNSNINTDNNQDNNISIHEFSSLYSSSSSSCATQLCLVYQLGYQNDVVKIRPIRLPPPSSDYIKTFQSYMNNQHVNNSSIVFTNDSNNTPSTTSSPTLPVRIPPPLFCVRMVASEGSHTHIRIIRNHEILLNMNHDNHIQVEAWQQAEKKYQQLDEEYLQRIEHEQEVISQGNIHFPIRSILQYHSFLLRFGEPELPLYPNSSLYNTSLSSSVTSASSSSVSLSSSSSSSPSPSPSPSIDKVQSAVYVSDHELTLSIPMNGMIIGTYVPLHSNHIYITSRSFVHEQRESRQQWIRRLRRRIQRERRGNIQHMEHNNSNNNNDNNNHNPNDSSSDDDHDRTMDDQPSVIEGMDEFTAELDGIDTDDANEVEALLDEWIPQHQLALLPIHSYFTIHDIQLSFIADTINNTHTTYKLYGEITHDYISPPFQTRTCSNEDGPFWLFCSDTSQVRYNNSQKNKNNQHNHNAHSFSSSSSSSSSSSTHPSSTSLSSSSSASSSSSYSSLFSKTSLSLLCSGSEDGSMHIWDEYIGWKIASYYSIHPKLPLHELQQHPSSYGIHAPLSAILAGGCTVNSVKWHPIYPYCLASVADDRTVKLWTLTQQQIQDLLLALGT